MNMNSNPTMDDLRALFSSRNDDECHHILWVRNDGEVLLSGVPEELTPVGFEQNTPEMEMRYETFVQGNQYVGKGAAQDDAFMERIYKSLVKEWPKSRRRKMVDYIDML